jgi:hypothetical protein
MPDRQFGTDYMAWLMAQSRYDAIAISEADFYEGPATLSDYMTRLIAASQSNSIPAPSFLASKYAPYASPKLFNYIFESFRSI